MMGTQNEPSFILIHSQDKRCHHSNRIWANSIYRTSPTIHIQDPF